MFLTITTRLGGREERPRGRVVDDSGEDGVKPPNDPNAPKPEAMKGELPVSFKCNMGWSNGPSGCHWSLRALDLFTHGDRHSL
jgi:hypothetical protein